MASPTPFRTRPNADDLRARASEPDRGFRLSSFVRSSIEQGPWHFGFLVPHLVLLPLYVAHRVLHALELWPTQWDEVLHAQILPVVQALALGSVVGGGIVYLQRRRAPKSSVEDVAANKKASAKSGGTAGGVSTADADPATYQAQMALVFSVYVLFGVTVWQLLPRADEFTGASPPQPRAFSSPSASWSSSSRSSWLSDTSQQLLPLGASGKRPSADLKSLWSAATGGRGQPEGLWQRLVRNVGTGGT